MKKENIEQQIEATREHMETLHKRARALPEHQQGLVLEALEELSTTLEKLQVAGKELDQLTQLASLPELNPNPIIEVDSSGQICYLNSAAKQLFPDLQKTGFQHPWLTELESLAETFDRRGNISHVRELRIGARWYEQVIYYFPEGKRLRIYGLDITDRKKTEERLKESEKKYRELYEGSPDGFVRVDMEGHLKEFNRAYREMLGYAEDELKRLTYMDLTPEKWHSMEAEIVKEQILKKGYSGVYEKEYIKKDGTIFPVELRAVYLTKDENGKPTAMWAFVRDITERKRAEEQLRSFFTISPDLLCIAGFDGFFKELSQSWEETLGYSIKELLSKPWLDFVHSDDREATIEAGNRLFEGKRVIKFENRYRTKDGQYRWIEWHATPLMEEKLIHCVARDITERKWAELERHKFVSLADNSTEFIGMCDMQFNPFYVNKAGLDMVGLDSLEQACATPVKEFFFPEDQRFIHEEFFPRVVREGRGEVEIRFRHFKTGEALWMIYNVFFVKDADGQPVGLATVSRNITERKKASEEIRRINEDLKRRTLELEAANKELEAFSYSVSHDLRTPIISIGGFSRLVSEEYSPCLDEKGQKYLETIYTSAQRSIRLMEDLLALSRAGHQELNLSEIDMGKLIEEVSKDLQPTCAGRIVQWYTKPLPSARGDPIMIRQVFVNLLTNAIKFTRPKETAMIEIGGKCGNGQNVYYVKDNGIGFDLEDASRLFEVFKRLHSPGEFEGTGVGLAIVQRIIQRHGGSVWAEGKTNEGATFYFTLPKVE